MMDSFKKEKAFIYPINKKREREREAAYRTLSLSLSPICAPDRT
jgi:hypothetical protein